MLINLRDKNGKLVIKDILDIDFNMCCLSEPHILLLLQIGRASCRERV